MRLGFTGTRNGMTYHQSNALMDLFLEYEGKIEFHHGDCLGSDAQAHAMLDSYFADTGKIVIHPGYSQSRPGDTSMRAFCVGGDVRAPKSHFARNRDIVNETDRLIATPPCKPLPSSGGTAYTVGYARKQGKPVTVIYPDGEIEEF